MPRWPARYACLGGASAATSDVRVPGGAYNVRLTSLKEARFRTTLPQQYDFSCGSAATATLLTHQYGHPVSEVDVFVQMYNNGDQAAHPQGRVLVAGHASLPALEGLRGGRLRGAAGQAAAGERAGDRAAQRSRLPHFVVVKGLRDGRVLLGDPARGTRAMPRSRFEALWDNRVMFVVHNQRERARFNQASDWKTAPPAP
ncbi:hypothetical protein BVRB_033270, partial [Beta vulgaris subsp. vulgaris]